MSAALELHPEPGHPGAVVAAVHELLDGVAADLMGPGDFAGVIAELSRARSRLQSLELKLVAAAERDHAPQLSGARSTGAWVAQQTRSDGAQAARDARLARELDVTLPTTASALGAGEVSPAHAAVIAGATRQLPRSLTPDQRRAVEQRLVDKARVLDPRQLRRVARRALEAVEHDTSVVDATEDGILRDEEALALSRTRLTLHDNGDGTTSGHFRVPTLAATVLRKVVDAMTAPRRGRLGATEAQAGDQRLARDPAHERGLALTTLLEHLPTDRLSSKVAATVIVKLDLDTLRGQLKAGGLDTDGLVSAAEARRLACNAGLVPPSSTARRSCSTSGAASASSPRHNAPPAPSGTPAAPPTGATSRTPGPSSTTGSRGPAAVVPTSRTWCRSAGSTTAASTTVATSTGDYRTGRSGSVGGREATARQIDPSATLTHRVLVTPRPGWGQVRAAGVAGRPAPRHARGGATQAPPTPP